MQLSSLIGKPIFTPQGEALGFVLGAYLTRDLQALSALVAVDDEEEEFYLPVRAICSFGDAVIAQRRTVSSPAGVPAPIGTGAYSHTGEHLGTVGDWLFGDTQAVFILVKNGVQTSCPAENAVAGETLIVYPDAIAKRPAPARKKPAAKKKKPAPNPKAEPVPPKNEASVSETEPISVKNEAPMPKETVQTENGAPVSAPPPAATPPYNEFGFNRGNLLGRKVRKSVFDIHGVPVALAGERITPEILSRARRSNRLLTLTVNTLTNVY